MLGKELQMQESNYELVADRICLLSNNLPSGELKGDSDGLNTVLFLKNLSLNRKNKRLNRFNRQLHQKISGQFIKVMDIDEHGMYLGNA